MSGGTLCICVNGGCNESHCRPANIHLDFKWKPENRWAGSLSYRREAKAQGDFGEGRDVRGSGFRDMITTPEKIFSEHSCQIDPATVSV